MKTKVIGLDVLGSQALPRWIAKAISTGRLFSRPVKFVPPMVLRRPAHPLGELRMWSEYLDGIIIFAWPVKGRLEYETLNLEGLFKTAVLVRLFRPMPSVIRGSISNICIGVKKDHYEWCWKQNYDSKKDLLEAVPFVG